MLAVPKRNESLFRLKRGFVPKRLCGSVEARTTEWYVPRRFSTLVDTRNPRKSEGGLNSREGRGRAVLRKRHSNASFGAAVAVVIAIARTAHDAPSHR
jgi:hypothetical protein